MIYEISHRTLYRYQHPVTQSQHLIHLAPAAAPSQSVLRHSLLVQPAPTSRRDFRDYFGNPCSVLSIEDEHTELVIHARSTIDVTARPRLDLQTGIAWDKLVDHLVRDRNEIDVSVVQFGLPSPETPALSAVRDYAAPSFPAGRPALSAAWDLTHRIHRDFTFDPTATEVTTPVWQILERRRGVCQDFAHLMLAALHAMRVPARYVSGYLLTRPPPGKPKLQGADASHAWVSVWTPECDWVDFDPTNDTIADDEHIAFAFGRDYRDISPISGILLGGGQHSVTVAVDVVAANGSPGRPDGI